MLATFIRCFRFASSAATIGTNQVVETSYFMSVASTFSNH